MVILSIQLLFDPDGLKLLFVRMIEERKLFGCLALAFLCIFSLFLGFAELIFSGVRHEINLDKKCAYLWGWTVAEGIIDLFSFVILCRFLYTRTGADLKTQRIWAAMQVFQIAPIIVMIWATNTYITISSHCYDLLSDRAAELWTFIVIHMSMMWIGVIVLICFLIVAVPMALIRGFFRAAGQ